MSTPQVENLGVTRESFILEIDRGRPLAELVEACGFGMVHFFIAEALQNDAIAQDTDGPEQGRFALLSYEHPIGQIGEYVFSEIAARGHRQANLRELLAFALQTPDAQLTHDIIALGTLRERRVYTDRPGESAWGSFELDRSICQWGVGLSRLGKKRTLVPVELFLKAVLDQPMQVLVRLED